jgi:Scramblase
MTKQFAAILASVEEIFDFQSLRIQQPGKLLADRASYHIFNDQRQLIATATEATGRGRVKLLRDTITDVREFAITTPAGVLVFSLIKQATTWSTEIQGPGGEVIGRIRTEPNRRHYTLLDDKGVAIGQAIGDLGLKRFSVTAAEGGTFARVKKTWAGLRKEMLTSSDHYKIEFTGVPVSRLARVLTVMVPIVLDLTSYEPL